MYKPHDYSILLSMNIYLSFSLRYSLFLKKLNSNSLFQFFPSLIQKYPIDMTCKIDMTYQQNFFVFLREEKLYFFLTVDMKERSSSKVENILKAAGLKIFPTILITTSLLYPLF